MFDNKYQFVFQGKHKRTRTGETLTVVATAGSSSMHSNRQIVSTKLQLSRQADDKISFFLAPTHRALVHPLHDWGSIKNDSYLLVLSPKSVTPPYVTFWTPNDTFCRKSGLFKWMDGYWVIPLRLL